jgi:AraC family transcriptional regulator
MKFMREPTAASGEQFDPLHREGIVPFEAAAASDELGWSGVQAVRYRVSEGFEIDAPPFIHHTVVLSIRPPEAMDLRYDGVERHTPLQAGSISVVPAGSPVYWRWGGPKDSLHVYLEPGLIERVAAGAFDLDPSRVEIPPLDGLDLPQLRATMQSVNAELMSGGTGGSLAAESLANVLAVYLIRHLSAGSPPIRGRDGKLPQVRLRAIVEYIEEHLETGPTLEQMAAVARLSPYHFARQFKAATGLPPHQYVIARRVERGKRLLQESEFPLVQVASRAGFSDQSQFTRHFKRLVGVTPQRFRMPASSD